MQINSINFAETNVKDDAPKVAGDGIAAGAQSSNGVQGGFHVAANGAKHASSLRNLHLNEDNPTYNKSTLKNQLTNDTINAEDSVSQMRTEMAVASMTMSENDLAKIQENGLSAKDMTPDNYIDIADKIRLQLAKGGADISMTGGLDRADLTELSGDANYAAVMEKAFEKADLPAYESGDAVMDESIEALQKTGEIQKKTADGLSPDAMKYMLQNELEPTIGNLYDAVFSGADGQNVSQNISSVSVTIGDGYMEQSYGESARENAETALPDELRAQLVKKIEEANLPADEAHIEKAADMLQKQIPVTPENLVIYEDLEAFSIQNISAEDVAENITDILREGKMPQDAYLIDGYSLMDKARAGVADVEAMYREMTETVRLQDGQNAADSQNVVAEQGDANGAATVNTAVLTAHRQLEEARLMMSVEANFALLKQGISIDTTDLTKLVEDLKEQEQALVKSLLKDDKNTPETVLNARFEIYETVTEEVNSLKEMPAVLLGRIPEVGEDTIRHINEAGQPLKARFEAAGERYETMQTEVRRDLGDSMKKAFQNVDDILDDLGFETTEQNERAVRILAYNEMELTGDNVTMIKRADMLMQKTFANLTPGVVTRMIKDGTNPLDMTIDELNEKAEAIKANNPEMNEEEKFSRFLRKLEETNGISEEERNSFLGVFRLIHQVDKADGAQIGMLLKQGQDVTMRNLLTATRSRKHENREVTIDDNFGMMTDFKRESLSITEQIEMAFQTDCLRQAGEEISPDKMTQFENEDAYLNLSPEQFENALSNMEESGEGRAIERQILKEDLRDIRNAVQSEEEIYRMLDNYDIPQTPTNLMAMAALMADRNGAFKTLTQPKTKLDEARENRRVDHQVSAAASKIADETLDELLGDLDTIIEDSIKDFGEAVKTPEEMAEAERKLAETAENVTRNAILEDGTASLDIRAMQLMKAEMSVFSMMAQNETYNIPVTVNDVAGNMTVKIVRGTEQKGLVDIAFSSDKTGNLSAHFHADGDKITGNILTDSVEAKALFEERKDAIADVLRESTGQSDAQVSLTVSAARSVELNDIYGESETDFAKTTEREGVQTRTLYGIARAFMTAVEEME